MTGLPLAPIYVVDMVGAMVMLLLAVIALKEARGLVRSHPESVLFSYLFWLSLALVAFSISRSFGHVMRTVLLFAGHPDQWRLIAPVSGGLNTLTLVCAAVLTVYYPNVRSVMAIVRGEAEALRQAKLELEQAHASLQELNQTLEERVEERSRELVLSEQKFRRLFEGSKDLIFFCDGNGVITDMNRSGAALLGYDRADGVVGRRLKDFFADQEQWRNYCRNMADKGFVKDFEAVLVRRDGERLYLIITAEALRDGDRLAGCEGIAKDMTAYRKMMEKLVYSEKMAAIGQLSAGVAHEVNTPLGVILGYTQMLKEELGSDSQALEDLEIIERQTKKCKRIVRDLLSFSRTTTSANPHPVDLPLCMEGVLAVVRHGFERDRIDIEVEAEADLPQVMADEDRLSQVFMNLLANARQAISHDGLVLIRMGRQAACGRVQVEVADSGPGIPDEIKGKIFDPFFTTKPAGEGTGLGLSVSYGIIQEYNGTIECESPPADPVLRQKGLNTVMRMSLPACEG